MKKTIQRKRKLTPNKIVGIFLLVFNKIKNKRDNGKITNKTILPSNAVLKIYCPEKKDGFVKSSPQLIYLET